jgi:hypothetical protein
MHLNSDKGCIIQSFFATFVRLSPDDFTELAIPPNVIRHEALSAVRDFSESGDELLNLDFIWNFAGCIGYTHVYLAICCMVLLLDVGCERCVLPLFPHRTLILYHRRYHKYTAVRYAKEYWAMHVVSCDAHILLPLFFGDFLKALATKFDALELDAGDAQLVVRWLKAHYFLFFYSPFQVIMLYIATS